MKQNIIIIFILFGLIIWQSCSPAGGNDTGHEYMPDMAHSIAVEANVDQYYFYHTWNGKENYRKYASPNLPVSGTIPRGAAGVASGAAMLSGELSNNAIRTSKNGHVPYYYGNTEEERIRATKEIITNPFPISAAGLQSGKELYNIYCGICHGEKGDGNGYLVRDDGGVYPAQPANLIKDEFIATSEGRLYHGIMYGRNVMMSYADKLSYEERWNVIHYIRALQANSKSLKYSETENTFSGSQAVADAKKMAAAANVNTTSTK